MKTHKVIIADTSFLIAIQKMRLFDEVHALYHAVYITRKIAEEFQLELPDWISVHEPKNGQVETVLSFIIDAGEASAIALAYDYQDAILIIDDLKARKEAARLGFNITGTLGVLIKLKKEGMIISMEQRISQLKEIGFRISPKIAKEILKSAGEN